MNGAIPRTESCSTGWPPLFFFSFFSWLYDYIRSSRCFYPWSFPIDSIIPIALVEALGSNTRIFPILALLYNYIRSSTCSKLRVPPLLNGFVNPPSAIALGGHPILFGTPYFFLKRMEHKSYILSWHLISYRSINPWKSQLQG